MSDITRSEAIKTLKEHLSHWERLLQEHICEEQEGIDTISALKLAIASLETDEAYDLEYEQPEFCKNCIDREAVYYYISSHIHEIITESGTDKNAHTNAILRSLANGVKTMPSVLPKVTKNDLGVDAVSRKELLKIYEDRFSELQKLKHLKDNKGAEDRQMGVNYCINILKELPSVTPQEPRKGHWIIDTHKIRTFGSKNATHDYSVHCDKCNYAWDYTTDNEESLVSNFCPNCGAKMTETEG